MSQISQIKKIYHAAIYVRLSKEDGAVASHEKLRVTVSQIRNH
jgi:site-specific DNA recombinase